MSRVRVLRLLGAVCVLLCVSSAQAQMLLSDDFDTNQTDINADLSSRQAGSLATATWSYSHATGQTPGYGPLGSLRLNPSAGPNIVSVSLDQNFTQDPGVNGYQYVRLKIDPGADGWLGIAVAEKAFIKGWYGANSWIDDRQGVRMIFRDSGGFTAWAQDTQISSAAYAGTGAHTIELRFSDPAGGAPFDGSGATKVELFVDGSTTAHLTHTQASPGYTKNYITFLGERDANTPYHEMDDFEIGLYAPVSSIPTLSEWGMIALFTLLGLTIVRRTFPTVSR